MLIESNHPKHYANIRKHWASAANPYSKDPTEGVLRVTEAIADQMPDLGLPRMPQTARAAFKDVLMYERPSGNASVTDVLTLAQSRGYCAHPCDWVPSAESDGQFLEIYEPWAAWLAENTYTPFYEGVRLTVENFDLWKPRPRVKAFAQLRRTDRVAADHLLMTVVAQKPVAVRRDLVKVIGANAMFNGLYPDDVPTITQFLQDRDATIRTNATQKLAEMDGLHTKADQANALAAYFDVSDTTPRSELNPTASHPEIIVSDAFYKNSVTRHCFSTDLDALVDALGITATDFARGFDLEHFKGDLFALSMRTTDMDARKILASRVAEAGKDCPAYLFKGVEPEVWKKALLVNLGSNYPSTAVNFLGLNLGTLDIADVRRLSQYSNMIPSIQREIETGERQIKTLYDPLRITGLLASKEAAAEVLNEALAAGITPDNPRLTLLTYNLAL